MALNQQLVRALVQELKSRDWLHGSLVAACQEAEQMLEAGCSINDAAFCGKQAALRHERLAPITEIVAHEIERQQREKKLLQ
jgi:hypothetical protein